MKTVEVSPETTIAYEDSGGDGPAVIMGHGFLMDRRTFDEQVSGIDGVRWIRWDLRGHGQSSSTVPSYSFWDQARDALCLLDSLGIDKAVFGGHSQGGFVALRMALLAPERCAGLILFSTSDDEYGDEIREGYRGFFSGWSPADEASVPIVSSLATTMIGGPRELQMKWRERWAARPTDDFLPAVNCLVEVDDIRELTPSLVVPAFVSHGAAEQAFSESAVSAMCARLGGTFLSVESAPHGAHMVNADQINAALKRWLEEHSIL